MDLNEREVGRVPDIPVNNETAALGPQPYLLYRKGIKRKGNLLSDKKQNNFVENRLSLLVPSRAHSPHLICSFACFKFVLGDIILVTTKN